MGQKVNPIGLRLGINRTWDSRWYAGKNEYGQLLHEDMKIREELMKQLKQAAVSKIVIERPHKKCRVTIHSARVADAPDVHGGYGGDHGERDEVVDGRGQWDELRDIVRERHGERGRGPGIDREKKGPTEEERRQWAERLAHIHVTSPRIR